MILLKYDGEVEGTSVHPYEPFNTQKATKLVIGSIPPPNVCNRSKPQDIRHDWYYGNTQSFWEILAEVSEQSLDDADSWKKFCQTNAVGVFDIVEKCDRIKSNAKDANIRNIKSINIMEILKANSNEVLQLFFTSKWVAERFNEYFDGAIIVNPENREKFEKVAYNDKTLQAITLWSPSPVALLGMIKNNHLSSEKNKALRIKQYKLLTA